MNYILVDQTAADPRYNVSFSVTCDVQSVSDKALANIPLKPNCRTNIVGDIFDTSFNFTIPVIISPEYEREQELTTVTVFVGQNAASAVLTLVFPAVTKTEYSAATVQTYVKVGNGTNP